MLGLIWSDEPVLPPSLTDILAQGEDLEKETVYRNNSNSVVEEDGYYELDEEEMEIHDKL